jgi:uncharacterized protein
MTILATGRKTKVAARKTQREKPTVGSGQPPHTPAVKRTLDIASLVEKKSHFLLGPRQTGKSFLIRTNLPNARIYDLLDHRVFLDLSTRPTRLEEELGPKNQAKGQIIVIDEIQRIPTLLNEVHRLIESHGVRFLLTGSSARKLRSGGINLLGGRARTRHLHPLCYAELGKQFDLAKALNRGLLPSIYFSDSPDEDLRAYASMYLQQEIVAEGATRNIPAFSRFLKVAALCNATVVNFTEIANDAQVPRTTVYEYFNILRDTLLLEEVPAWSNSRTRKPLVSSKYYFFDVGVVASLQGRRFLPNTPEYGQAFETYLAHELFCYRDYRLTTEIKHWRSASGFEVDFMLGEHTAIEVKAKHNVGGHDLRSLHAIGDEKNIKRRICVSLESRSRHVDGIEILPVEAFLSALWDGAYE